MNESHLIIYDGECIFCQNYVKFLRLRENIGPVELLNARSDDPRVQSFWAQGYDLNEGMLFVWNGRVFHGAKAMHKLAELSGDRTRMGRLRDAVLSRSGITTAIYPLLKLGRRTTLFLMGRKTLRRDESPRREP
jgi:predicted DCC family thiol-disulfide oxidoreductase YuxK